jgi:hypothetical protein
VGDGARWPLRASEDRARSRDRIVRPRSALRRKDTARFVNIFYLRRSLYATSVLSIYRFRHDFVILKFMRMLVFTIIKF